MGNGVGAGGTGVGGGACEWDGFGDEGAGASGPNGIAGADSGGDP